MKAVCGRAYDRALLAEWDNPGPRPGFEAGDEAMRFLLLGWLLMSASDYPIAAIAAAADDATVCLEETGDEAIAACTRAIASGDAPRHILALLYFNRGDEFHDKGDFDRAIADYTQAITIDPNYGEAYRNRGWSLFNRGDIDRAFSDYNEAIRLNPTSALALTRRGYARYTRGDITGALSDYDEAIRLGPERPYYERGNVWYDQGDLDRAIADYDQHIRLDPDFADAYRRRADALRQKGELDRAIADYSAAIDRGPTAAWSVYLRRGEVFEAKGEFDRAIFDYGNAISLNTKSTRAYIRRGNLYLKNGDLDRAIVDYSAAIRLNPNLAVAFRGRGNIYMQRGDRNRAIVEYTQSIKLDPKEASSYFSRGVARLYDRAPPDAVSDFATASEIAPNDPYIALWHHIAGWRSGPSVSPAKPSSEIDLAEWPGAVLRLFRGEIMPPALLEAADSDDPEKKRARLCEAAFYVGMLKLQMGENDTAQLQFQIAARDCPPEFIERQAAVWELDALAATRRGSPD